MAVAHNPAGSDGAETSLDRLEAALESIARGLGSSRPPEMPSDPAVLDEVEQRLDAVIEHVKTVLGRKSDQ